jgi:hypothetical protein
MDPKYTQIKNINFKEKIVAIEIAGQRGLAQNAEWICRQERKATIAQLMDREQMENQRKQLYRLCEIRQSN